MHWHTITYHIIGPTLHTVEEQSKIVIDDQKKRVKAKMVL